MTIIHLAPCRMQNYWLICQNTAVVGTRLNIQRVSFTAALSTAAVTGCPGQRRLSTRRNCRARYDNKRQSVDSPHCDQRDTSIMNCLR
jgi:hypothetical protein